VLAIQGGSRDHRGGKDKGENIFKFGFGRRWVVVIVLVLVVVDS
jgi:hypothetical protein